jgi:hypothetical protein
MSEQGLKPREARSSSGTVTACPVYLLCHDQLVRRLIPEIDLGRSTGFLLLLQHRGRVKLALPDLIVTCTMK